MTAWEEGRHFWGTSRGRPWTVLPLNSGLPFHSPLGCVCSLWTGVHGGSPRVLPSSGVSLPSRLLIKVPALLRQVWPVAPALPPGRQTGGGVTSEAPQLHRPPSICRAVLSSPLCIFLQERNSHTQKEASDPAPQTPGQALAAPQTCYKSQGPKVWPLCSCGVREAPAH